MTFFYLIQQLCTLVYISIREMIQFLETKYPNYSSQKVERILNVESENEEFHWYEF